MTITNLLHHLADHLDLEPSRPVDIHRLRVRARMIGLTTEWIGLLPEPGDTRQSAYANRLRQIADGGA